MTINTDTHITGILNLLKDHGLFKDNLIIADNPYAYAREKNLKDIKECMIGYSYTDTNGKKIIILKKLITDVDQKDALQRIIYQLDRGRKNFLKSPERFIEHLVRHEIEHCVFGKPQAQESEADEDVLRKMGFLETGTGF